MVVVQGCQGSGYESSALRVVVQPTARKTVEVTVEQDGCMPQLFNGPCYPRRDVWRVVRRMKHTATTCDEIASPRLVVGLHPRI